MQVEDQGIARLHTLTGLTSLGLAGCVALTERALGHVAARMPSLTCLKLGGCSRVATITDACLLHLDQLTALTHLDLAGCLEVSDAGRGRLQHAPERFPITSISGVRLFCVLLTCLSMDADEVGNFIISRYIKVSGLSLQ